MGDGKRGEEEGEERRGNGQALSPQKTGCMCGAAVYHVSLFGSVFTTTTPNLLHQGN